MFSVLGQVFSYLCANFLKAGIMNQNSDKFNREGLTYDDVLLAPKVCLMANWQANIVLELLVGDII